MGYVMGCSVVNVMVYLFINLQTALVVRVQFFMILDTFVTFVLY
jgi:hypothetical protein